MTTQWNRKQNCYAYAFGDSTERNWKDLQPGKASGVGSGRPYDCNVLTNRVLADNKDTFSLKSCEQKCPKNYRKIAMAVAPPNVDYHFFREDDVGEWSHKLGKGKIYKMYDEPWNQSRKFGNNDYSDFCGCFCTLADNTLFSGVL